MKKRDFNIVYQPLVKPRKRFLISLNRLPDYLPENRVKQVRSILSNLKADKQRIGLYEHGIIDVYVK